jgi:hypothetical protein
VTAAAMPAQVPPLPTQGPIGDLHAQLTIRKAHHSCVTPNLY